jgi:hypothetical protein
MFRLLGGTGRPTGYIIDGFIYSLRLSIDITILVKSLLTKKVPRSDVMSADSTEIVVAIPILPIVEKSCG